MFAGDYTSLLEEEIITILSRTPLTISSAGELDQSLQQVVDAARMVTGAEYAAVQVTGMTRLADIFIFSCAEEVAPLDVPRLLPQTGVLRTIIEERRSLRTPQVNQSKQAIDLPLDFLPLQSFLGTPVVVNETVVGCLYLLNKINAGAFVSLDQKLLEMFATHAAVIIRNAKLLSISREYSQQLEQRNQQLAVLNQAAMAIAGELSLDKVLQQIVNSVRELVSAEYAALGVPNAEGLLETFVFSGMAPEDAARLPHLPRGLGLLGAIIQEKRPIRLRNIQDDPRSVGFPPGHPPMTSFLGVPVVAGGQTFGNLYLTNKIGADEFTLEDQKLVEMLAAHAAIAVENARLYEQVGRLAIVEERTRIGMDLHDGIIQSIYAVGLTLESTRLALPQNQDRVDALLGQAIEALNDTIRDIRNFILDLRPHRFRGDLDQGLARLVREFQANTVVPVNLNVSPEAVNALPTPVARAIFLTTQEALANIARHARANQVTISARRRGNMVELAIADDGRGFDAGSQTQAVGHGLSNMRARAEELRGSFNLRSAPGQGTQIILQLPAR